MNGRLVVGIDFGTLSGRAVLADLSSGMERATAVYDYPHGVMDRSLPGGIPLGQDWALQHPQDWLDVLSHTIPEILREARADPSEVVGIGVDCTACTILPAKADGTPLCFLPEFRDRPHAYPKLWKHHAAQTQASRMTQIAAERGELWLRDYGGKISSEWAFPKLWQVLEEDPQIYAAVDRWIEAADWIVWRLCGRETRNACAAGYKALYNKRTGFPSREYFRAIDPRLERAADKLCGPILPAGSLAGTVTRQAADRTGLREGTAVAVGNVDAHVCVPAAGISGPGKLLAIMGTSTCHMVMGTAKREVPGMCGVVEDGILPGLFGYESGQACVGDHFAWFIDNCLPMLYYEEAARRGAGIHAFLREQAETLRPGESGLLALDWWNGNRSVLADADLSGMLLGLTLRTRPEEIYRALIEATAFGARMILENYREHGVPVEEFFASGGIPQKDPMTMQITADVVRMPVRVAGSAHGPALGSAMFAAAAAGTSRGGAGSIAEAVDILGTNGETRYRPHPENAAIYDKLYAEYRALHDYFGRGENNVMKRLKAMVSGN